MRLTTKGRFAVAAMLDLAAHEAAGAVSLQSISERQHISLSYLEQLFSKLRRRELVKSFRGPGGGYRLARLPAAISIAEVIDAVDEVVDVTNCHGDGTCKERWPCIAHHLWSGLNDLMVQYLASVSLADLVVANATCEEKGIPHTRPLIHKEFGLPGYPNALVDKEERIG